MAHMSVEEALGTLIRLLNPYTDGSGGSMTIGVGGDVTEVDVKNVRMEIDDYHEEAGQWIFKGLPQRIARAVRIEYRHKVKGVPGDHGVLATEHILIGYAGSNSG